MGQRFCISNKFPGDAHAAGPWTTLSRKDLTYCPQVLLHLLDTILSRTLSIAIHRNPTQIGIIKRKNLLVQINGRSKDVLALGMAASRSSNYIN